MGLPQTWRGQFGARWWPGGVASIVSAFSSSCRCMTTKARAKPPQTLVGRPTLGPTWPGVWHTWSMCQIPRPPLVMMIFGELHFVIPWNALIWYLSSWNQINTKIVGLGYQTRWIHGYPIHLLGMLAHEIDVLWEPTGGQIVRPWWSDYQLLIALCWLKSVVNRVFSWSSGTFPMIRVLQFHHFQWFSCSLINVSFPYTWL
jgi:hypothetical protein